MIERSWAAVDGDISPSFFLEDCQKLDEEIANADFKGTFVHVGPMEYSNLTIDERRKLLFKVDQSFSDHIILSKPSCSLAYKMAPHPMIVGKQKLSHEKEREREPWKIIKGLFLFACIPSQWYNNQVNERRSRWTRSK